MSHVLFPLSLGERVRVSGLFLPKDAQGGLGMRGK
jgi:hypothetical protein